eukprot:5873297-Amphidinium_carterae.1
MPLYCKDNMRLGQALSTSLWMHLCAATVWSMSLLEGAPPSHTRHMNLNGYKTISWAIHGYPLTSRGGAHGSHLSLEAYGHNV